MRIAVASDHAGYALKEEIKAVLEDQGHDVEDFGAPGEEAVDLSDHVYPAALAVGGGRAERGIFVDGVAQYPFCASLARSHSDTNVLCIGGKIIGTALAHEVVRAWMTTDYLADEPKYKRRVDKVREISERHLRPLGG